MGVSYVADAFWQAPAVFGVLPGGSRHPEANGNNSKGRKRYERTSASPHYIPLPTDVSVGARIRPVAGSEPDTIIPDRIQVGSGCRAEKDAASQRLQTCLVAQRYRTLTYQVQLL